MPQNFITNITIKLNKQALDTTFENLGSNEIFRERKRQ